MFDKDYKTIAHKIVSFIQKTVRDAGFGKVVIASSGGVDSSTIAYLTVAALEKENVFVVHMPYGDLHPKGFEDVQLVTKALKTPQENVIRIDITRAVDEIISSNTTVDKVGRGNIMARVRMIYLYDLAKKYRTLVCGTENKTEYLLGYFTRFGDEASDLEPLRGLYKTQVMGLARYLNIPRQIIARKPTAGLWEGQTDEGEFGFSYEKADQILHLTYDEKCATDEIIKHGFSKDAVDKVLNRARQNAFKHDVPHVLEKN